jgi:hypothetical protein
MIAAQRRQLVLRSLHQIAPSATRKKCFIAPLLQHVLRLPLVVNWTLESAEALEASTVEITTLLIRLNGAQQPQQQRKTPHAAVQGRLALMLPRAVASLAHQARN